MEIARYISLSEGMSLRDEFVENERTADEPRFEDLWLKQWLFLLP